MTASKTCDLCEKEPAVIGSRCVRCYVVYRAQHENLLPPVMLRSRNWWRFHEYDFIAALKARVAAIKAGVEPGPIDELVAIFYHGHYTPHRGAKSRFAAKRIITKMIETADRRIRGENDGEHAGDGGGPEGR